MSEMHTMVTTYGKNLKLLPGQDTHHCHAPVLELVCTVPHRAVLKVHTSTGTSTKICSSCERQQSLAMGSGCRQPIRGSISLLSDKPKIKRHRTIKGVRAPERGKAASVQ